MCGCRALSPGAAKLTSRSRLTARPPTSFASVFNSDHLPINPGVYFTIGEHHDSLSLSEEKQYVHDAAYSDRFRLRLDLRLAACGPESAAGDQASRLRRSIGNQPQ